MNNLILVRHGQSQWNKERRFTGWADIGLTQQGQGEALVRSQEKKQVIDCPGIRAVCLNRKPQGDYFFGFLLPSN